MPDRPPHGTGLVYLLIASAIFWICAGIAALAFG